MEAAKLSGGTITGLAKGGVKSVDRPPTKLILETEDIR